MRHTIIFSPKFVTEYNRIPNRINFIDHVLKLENFDKSKCTIYDIGYSTDGISVSFDHSEDEFEEEIDVEFENI